VKTLGQLSCELRETHEINKSWEITSEPYGINKAMARLIANGYQPGNKIRARLGLCTLAPAPICPVHGVVHPGRCPRKPVTNWRMTPEEFEARLEFIMKIGECNV
jgi:hypothetical protein